MTLFSAAAAILVVVLMIRTLQVNRHITGKKLDRTEKYKQIIYTCLLLLNLLVFAEFTLTWNYFWLTQIKLAVFFLANASQTMTITYMVLMASRAVKKLQKMIRYSFVVFIVGVLVSAGNTVFVEQRALVMIQKEFDHYEMEKR